MLNTGQEALVAHMAVADEVPLVVAEVTLEEAAVEAVAEDADNNKLILIR